MKSEIKDLLLQRFDTIDCRTCKWYNHEEEYCEGICDYEYPNYSINEKYAEKLEEEILDIIHNKMLGM